MASKLKKKAKEKPVAGTEAVSASVASVDSLEKLLGKTDKELKQIQPKIEALEKQLDALKELKLRKQRLLTLKMSLMAMLESDTKLNKVLEASPGLGMGPAAVPGYDALNSAYTFSPEEAFAQVQGQLRATNSLNYQIFQAVVFNGGKASTEAIKQYLVETEAKQPQTGEGFEAMSLSEISSRANYLIRKGILNPHQRGVFYTHLGWMPANTTI
ncbi:MAG: hypothetical protein KC474_06290 [Cyanobacteria bacterium HKST-UBA04]|nr:hypothetical protein [Cyanobacteria bacterium HKST-UBA04]